MKRRKATELPVDIHRPAHMCRVWLLTSAALVMGAAVQSQSRAASPVDLLPASASLRYAARPRAPNPNAIRFEAPPSLIEHSRLGPAQPRPWQAAPAQKGRDQESSDIASRSGALTVHWRTQPPLVQIARQFRRNGLPIARFGASGGGVLAVGLSSHGVPGLYFTQNLQK